MKINKRGQIDQNLKTRSNIRTVVLWQNKFCSIDPCCLLFCLSVKQNNFLSLSLTSFFPSFFSSNTHLYCFLLLYLFKSGQSPTSLCLFSSFHVTIENAKILSLGLKAWAAGCKAQTNPCARLLCESQNRSAERTSKTHVKMRLKIDGDT